MQMEQKPQQKLKEVSISDFPLMDSYPNWQREVGKVS